jgi:hypothetical protein
MSGARPVNLLQRAAIARRTRGPAAATSTCATPGQLGDGWETQTCSARSFTPWRAEPIIGSACSFKEMDGSWASSLARAKTVRHGFLLPRGEDRHGICTSRQAIGMVPRLCGGRVLNGQVLSGQKELAGSAAVGKEDQRLVPVPALDLPW